MKGVLVLKRFVAGLIVGILLMCGIAVADQLIAQTANYKVVVNGQAKSLTETPVTINDRTYLPVRAVGEMLGYNVTFDGTKGEISLSNTPVLPKTEPEPITMRPKLFVNGVEQSLDYDMILKNGMYYYPALKIVKVFGLDDINASDGIIQFIYQDKTATIGKGEWFVYGDYSRVPINLVVERLGWSMQVEQTKLLISH